MFLISRFLYAGFYCIALVDFLLAGGDKVDSLADVEFTLVWCGSLADSLLQLPFVLALL